MNMTRLEQGFMPEARPRRMCRRKGLASVLSMLYLVLFSTLAVGFYAATTMSGQVSRNEKSLEVAESAADGGMQYLRYQLGLITIPPNTPTNQILNTVASQLGTQMNGTTNMQGNSIQVVSYNGSPTIFIPSQTVWAPVDPNTGTQFKAMIQQSGTFIVVTVDGAGPTQTITRAIQLQYQQAPKAGMILDYGVASRGTVSTAGSTYIQGATDSTKGSVLSADTLSSTPITINGKAVSGDVSIVNPAGNVAVGSGSSIGGTSDPTQIQNHIHKGVPAPIFPWIDTSMFTAYATNLYVPGATTLTNVYIPANTNPKFTGSMTINGVLWIQNPNTVTFRGGVTVNGVIVTDTSGSYDPLNNQISFGGNVNVSPLSALTPSNPAYDPNLVKLTGSFMLAPNDAVSMTGNFGTVPGSIVTGTMNMSGNATGTVSGSLITMVDNSSSVSLTGSSDIIISSMGTTQYPTGMNFGNDYAPLPGTYIEVAPW